jgi:hypothetical protein
MHKGEKLEVFRRDPDWVLMSAWSKMDRVVATVDVMEKYATNSLSAEKIRNEIKFQATNGYAQVEQIMKKMEPFVHEGADLFYYEHHAHGPNDEGYLVLDKNGEILEIESLGKN